MVNSQPYPIVSQLFETHISILIVDDADSDRLTYSRYLQSDSEKTYRIIEAATLEEGLELWRSQKPDIILLDLNLPDGNGLGFLEAINVDRSWENVPVIVLTGSGDEKKALQAIKLGATDYLVKGDLTAKSLSTAVKQVLQESWLKAQLQRSQQQQILIAAIALRIREFTDLDDISNAIVKEVRQFIKADRATIYKFNPADMSGKIVAEDIVSPWQPCLNVHVEDTCFRENLGGAYCEGRIFVANDIYAANLTACHIHLLERFQVRANLVVPILLPDVGQETLWGLLILHQCAAPRIWLETDIQLLQQLAVQLSISIQQAIAYQKVQADLVERKRFENLLLKYQADLEERNDFLESTTEDLQCTVEELRVSTEDLVTQHRQLDYEQIRYQNLFNFAPNGYLVTDTSGRIIEANQTILSLLAIDHEAILGQLLASFIDSYHLEFFYKHLNSLLSQNKLEAAEEFTIVPLQGKPFPAEIIATRNITADSNSIQLLWIVRNISDRKRAEEELLQLNQTLEAKVIERTQAIKLQSQMLEQTHDSVISTALDGTILTWNIGAEKLYEYEQNEAIGKNVSMLYLNEDLPLLEASVFRPPLEKENHEVELRNRTKSGKIIYIGLRLSLVRDALGKPAFLIGCSNNISNRKLSEESLRESEQRFANLAATAPVAIFQINQNNECTYVNEFWAQITGQESSMALGYGWLQTIHPDDREQIHQQWTQAIEQQAYYQNEGRCIRPDGTICCFYCQAVPVLDEDGVFKGYIGTLNDISDRKQAEVRLKLANQELLHATKLKDEFLANMSHELRTPLNAILGLSESLLEEILGSLNEKQLKAIATVESSGEHLLSLINDILDLSKVSSGMMTLDIEAVSVKNLCDTSSKPS
jgi:PAS domain S-box-containing protein